MVLRTLSLIGISLFILSSNALAQPIWEAASCDPKPKCVCQDANGDEGLVGLDLNGDYMLHHDRSFIELDGGKTLSKFKCADNSDKADCKPKKECKGAMVGQLLICKCRDKSSTSLSEDEEVLQLYYDLLIGEGFSVEDAVDDLKGLVRE